MRKLAFAVAGAILGATMITTPSLAAPPVDPTGTLSVTLDGDYVTNYFTFENVRKKDSVRIQTICQTENTSVVWGDAVTPTESPSDVTFGPITAGTYCRSSLFVVPSNWRGAGEIVYLATVKFTREP